MKPAETVMPQATWEDLGVSGHTSTLVSNTSQRWPPLLMSSWSKHRDYMMTKQGLHFWSAPGTLMLNA